MCYGLAAGEISVSETQTPTVFHDTSAVPLLKKHWALLLVALVVFTILGLCFRVSFYDRGYAPEQPIHYSHKLHAGDLGIDCRYCHFNAERGKHAGIPPTSVCLGCHATDKGGVNGDKPEIQKLLAMADNGSGSYTDDNGVIHEGGAIHWNRVHKLPDFVYFSHQWHVKAGVSCQTCHGPVEEMTVLRQHATLTMGWCLDCHRSDNYVGGREWDPKDPATFSVGTGNYDVIRSRIKPDLTVAFLDRQTKKHTDADKAEGAEPAADHGHDHDHTEHTDVATGTWDRPFGHAGSPTPKQDEMLADLLKQFPHLKGSPTWRLADLPETHQAIYREMIEEKAGRPLAELTTEEQQRWLAQLSFQNSPTQCSTCHQ